MTRFNISLTTKVNGEWAMNMRGGELLVPKIPSYRITDVAEAIGPSCQNLLSAYAREKIHEEMITASDSFSTFDLGHYYAILPGDGLTLSSYRQEGIKAVPVTQGFAITRHKSSLSFCRGFATTYRSHVDPTFVPI